MGRQIQYKFYEQSREVHADGIKKDPPGKSHSGSFAFVFPGWKCSIRHDEIGWRASSLIALLTDQSKTLASQYMDKSVRIYLPVSGFFLPPSVVLEASSLSSVTVFSVSSTSEIA